MSDDEASDYRFPDPRTKLRKMIASHDLIMSHFHGARAYLLGSDNFPGAIQTSVLRLNIWGEAISREDYPDECLEGFYDFLAKAGDFLDVERIERKIDNLGVRLLSDIHAIESRFREINGINGVRRKPVYCGFLPDMKYLKTEIDEVIDLAREGKDELIERYENLAADLDYLAIKDPVHADLLRGTSSRLLEIGKMTRREIDSFNLAVRRNIHLF